MSKILLHFIYCSLAVFFISCGNNRNEGNNGNEGSIVDTPLYPDEIINNQKLSEGLFYPKGKELRILCSINGNSLTDDQRIFIATLQGLAAKVSSEQIFIEEGGATTVWKDYLRTDYGIEVKDFSSFDDLVKHFIDIIDIKGYVLYDRRKNPRSLTAATSLCGPLNAVAVDKYQERAILSLGITDCIMDVSDKDDKWVYQKYSSTFYNKFSAELSTEINHHLRDYVTLTNCFMFYDGLTPWRTEMLQKIPSGSICLGGGLDEFNMIKDATEQGVPWVGTDMASNLSILSSIYDTDGLYQPRNEEEVETENNVHYVCFMLTDGDNVAYDLWSMYDIFSSPLRGTFPVGYTISPSLYDLAPSVLNWYYKNKSNNDYFMCGPSGIGYTYPTMYPSNELDKFFIQCDLFASKTGLHICNVIDYGGINNMDLWEQFLKQPNIDAIFYTGYAEPANGSIKFASNGKPIIEAGDLLWGGLSEEEELINRINSKPTNPKMQEGYTFIVVHVWSKGFTNMKTVVDGFNKNIRVVTPENFVKLIKKNLGSK